MENAEDAFDRYHLGRAHHLLPPMYILIDKQGIIRYRRARRSGDLDGREKIEMLLGIVEELVGEE